MSNDPTSRPGTTEGIGPGLPPLNAAVRLDILQYVREAVAAIPRRQTAPQPAFDEAADRFITAGGLLGAADLFQWFPPATDRLACCDRELLENGAEANRPRHIFSGIRSGLVDGHCSIAG